jgi:hypothetical protein
VDAPMAMKTTVIIRNHVLILMSVSTPTTHTHATMITALNVQTTLAAGIVSATQATKKMLKLVNAVMLMSAFHKTWTVTLMPTVLTTLALKTVHLTASAMMVMKVMGETVPILTSAR